nr:HD domain-containing phosphohydrolase [Spirochaetota bacterium]
LHDVGKIGIPEAVLTKPGKLTDEERTVIRQHPVIGERICRPLRSTSSIISIVRSHHERWDGHGYPDGLSGETIPVEARIVSIADSFDAMVFDRVYRPALGLDRARSIFREERDRGQWDPHLVDIFLSIHESWLKGNML